MGAGKARDGREKLTEQAQKLSKLSLHTPFVKCIKYRFICDMIKGNESDDANIKLY